MSLQGGESRTGEASPSCYHSSPGIGKRSIGESILCSHSVKGVLKGKAKGSVTMRQLFFSKKT